MVFLVASLALVAIICLGIWILLRPKNHEHYFKNVPGPKPLPLFGNILEASSTKDVLDALMRFKSGFGGVVKVHVGPKRISLVVSDYKFLEAILSSTRVLNKADAYHHLRPWLGKGLLTSDGPKWRKHRRILTPAFHFQILEQFIDVFENEGNILVQKLQNIVGKPSVDVYPFVTLCTLDIICESAMGTSINAQFDDNSEYVKSVKAMCKIAIDRVFHVFQMSDFTFPLTRNYYLQKKSLKVLHKKTNDLITKRRKEKDESATDVTNAEDALLGKKKKAFLDLLLDATIDGRPLTQEEIREEVDTFMFEGHDTTASAISFALYCLANNSEAQQKAYEEQRAVFGDDKNPKTTYADLQSMKNLELVIKETLRLYPPVPFFGRQTNEQVQFENLVIPAGIDMMIFAYGIHRDPTYFKDPEKFDPNRFEGIDGKHPFAYIPFSAGPRNCIGQKFAMLEMKSTLSKILRNFDLRPASPQSEPQLVAESVLKSANGINISLSLRE